MNRPHYQRSPRRVWGILSALVGVVLVLAAPVSTAQDKPFKAPGFEEQLFDIDSVFIAPTELSRATSALAALASNFAESPEVTNDIRARALAISLRLDGVHGASSAKRSRFHSPRAPARSSTGCRSPLSPASRATL